MNPKYFFYTIFHLAVLSLLLIVIGCSPEKEPPPVVQIEKAEPVKIVSKAPTEALIDRDYVYRIKVTGTPVFKWKLVEGPDGMDIHQEGKLTLPADKVKEGNHKVKIVVSNIVGGKLCEDTQTFTLQIKKKDKEGKKKKRIAIPVSIKLQEV